MRGVSLAAKRSVSEIKQHANKKGRVLIG